MDPKLLELSGQAARRWKVGTLRLSFESVTVWANTPDEAARQAALGMGAPAESWGPVDAAMAAAEMGTPEASQMHIDAKYWLRPPGAVNVEEKD